MVEYILALIIFSLLGYIVWKDKQHQREVSQLLDRIMAKDLQEFQAATVPINQEKPEIKPPEFVPMQTLPDDEWDKLIKQQAGTETTKDKAIKKLKSLTRK